VLTNPVTSRARHSWPGAYGSAGREFRIAPAKRSLRLAQPGRQKAGLNRSIHANCWGPIAKRLEQKMSATGTTMVVVLAQYSRQQCRKCGHTSPENRKSQAEFRCQACGHADHADRNAAAIILARGTQPAPTPGPGATPTTGVLAQART
jgi:putative transposase